MSTIPDLTDTTAWPDTDLAALHSAVLHEMTRRQTLVEAETRTTKIAAAYLDARDGTQPTESAETRTTKIAAAYLDARDGTQPTESAETLADVATWPAWVQPTGAHNAYPAGRIVKHNGVLYRSLIAANVWEPGGKGVPAGLWKKVTAGAAGEAPATPTAPAWDGGGHAYKGGDLVTYSGRTYRVLQAHSSQAGWTPTAAPSLWVAV